MIDYCEYYEMCVSCCAKLVELYSVFITTSNRLLFPPIHFHIIPLVFHALRKADTLLLFILRLNSKPAMHKIIYETAIVSSTPFHFPLD